MYLTVSLCIVMYLPDPGQKIQKDTFRYDVSFCIFCPASGRYIKIHLDSSWKQDAASPKDSKKKTLGIFSFKVKSLDFREWGGFTYLCVDSDIVSFSFGCCECCDMHSGLQSSGTKKLANQTDYIQNMFSIRKNSRDLTRNSAVLCNLGYGENGFLHWL